MRKTLLALSITFIFFLCTSDLKAFIYGHGEAYKIERVLPDDCTINNNHVNLGVIYYQYDILWIPIWNGEAKFVFLEDNTKTYYELEEGDREWLKTEYNVEFPDKASPTLWDQIGLKPVIVIFILWYLWSTFFRKKEEKDEEQTINNTEE